MYPYMYYNIDVGKERTMTSDTHSTGHPRVAAVTGASSGIGVAIAEAIAQHGWPVAIGARRVERLGDVADRLRATGATVLAHPST
jgi:NADP-dependent 3-hydroxy acid dehydrogenase YdfG